MPIKKCQAKNKKGYKFSDRGKCYTTKNAKSKAKLQGRAIKASQSRRKNGIK